MKVSLRNLARRIVRDESLIGEHPECKEVLSATIQRSKDLIIRCVVNNAYSDECHMDNIYIEQ